MFAQSISKSIFTKKNNFKWHITFLSPRAHYRKILLQVAYFGWDYRGFVVQEDSEQTIERHLFKALTKTCLIENREKAEYHRCGRTDKGVSAYGQVSNRYNIKINK